jgi:hypothetical protein
MKFTIKSEWKNTASKIIFIALGIILGFSLNKWNSNRIAKSIEIEILKELNETLTSDIKDIERKELLFEISNRGINNIIFAFDQDLPYNDSLIKSFSTLIVNPMFFRNDAPFEVLKSKGFETITEETIRLEIINLYSVKYRALDYMLTVLPQLQNFDNLVGFLRKNFRKSKQENFGEYFSISIEPIDYNKLKSNDEFRFLIELVKYGNERKIWFLNDTKETILGLQEKIKKEIDRLN